MQKHLYLFFFCSLALGQPRFDKAATSGLSSITANDLRAHLTFLASDELEGRETSFRGQKVAAQYIAAVFRKLGLKPLGPDGSYFQRFELDVQRPSTASTIRLVAPDGSRDFSFGRDFFTTAAKETSMTASLVLAGFMDSEFTEDQEATFSNRFAVVFAGRRLEALDTTAVRSRRASLRSFRDAAAVIIVTDESSQGTIEDQTRALANFLEKGSMSLKGVARRGRGPLSVVVSSSLGAQLLSEFRMPLRDLRIKTARDTITGPKVLRQPTLTLNLKAIQETKTSENVVALLEGVDPLLKHEAVVLSAHYDHVGVNAATGDIYNGADDDGSGTSMILELAEAFSANASKPRRSLVFMTVAGEEKGLLGSFYYTTHPLVPLEKTIANINIDMIGRIDKKHEGPDNPPYVYVIGSDKISTELDSLLRSANNQTARLSLDYEYNDDKDPNQFYRRSDHYNFARNGVPIVFFFTGIHADYHRPTDTVEKIEFDRMVKIGQLAYATAWKAANYKRMLLKDGKPSVYSAEP